MKTTIKTVKFVRQDGIGMNDYRSVPYPFEVETVTQEEIDNDRPLVDHAPFLEAEGNCPIFSDDANGRAYYAREYRQERDRIQAKFFAAIKPGTICRVIKEIEPISLKKAVAPILLWDIFSGWTTRKLDNLCATDAEARSFLSFAKRMENIEAMQMWFDEKHRPQFAEALMRFGYFRENAEDRVKNHNQERVDEMRSFRLLEDNITRTRELHAKMVSHCKAIEDKARMRAARLLKEARDRAKEIKHAPVVRPSLKMKKRVK